MELNKEQTIKICECCVKNECDKCPIFKEADYCIDILAPNIIALIKELTEENERLAERVLAENHLRNQVEYMLKTVKSDTVREFAERLKKCFDNEIEHLAIYTEGQVLFAIDQIAKEMVEGGL